ncbi:MULTISPECIES: restriction endonuclease subunit S [unclassified Luteococcus]|uniref:restriction endonuclease subunit S n=1 Tax=unclassified Luteococcus TaxID=2639923 RepID=UPI00313C5480
MVDWTQTTLNDVASFQRGHDLPSQTRRSGTIPIIGSFGVTGYHDTALYPGPGVAIGRSGAAIGTATLVESAYWPLNTCLFVRDFHGNDPHWVYWRLKTIDFTAYNSGSAQPSLNRNFLGDIPVSLPPLPEQQAIAEVLGALDDKIAANRALVATMEQLMTAKIAALPITGALEDLCSLSKQSVSPESMAPEVWHYSLPAFDAGALPSLEKREDIKSNKFVVAQPSVLLSKLNPRFPRVWNLPSPQKDSVASTEFLVLEPRALDSSVLWALLSSPRVSGFLGEHAAGTSGSHQRVKPGEVMQLPMPTVVPHDLAEELAALGLRGEAARHEAATLASLQDTLLPALMDGTLRVKDVEKTVSEAL